MAFWQHASFRTACRRNLTRRTAQRNFNDLLFDVDSKLSASNKSENRYLHHMLPPRHASSQMVLRILRCCCSPSDIYDLANRSFLKRSLYEDKRQASDVTVAVVMSCMRVCRKQALSRVKYYYYATISKIQQATIMTV